MSQQGPPVRRARHLLDPDNPRPRQSSAAQAKSLDRVQKWVMSSLAGLTIMHLAVFAAVTAYVSDPSRLDARIGLNVMAGLIGMAAIVAGRLIHRVNPVSAWVLLGMLPGLIGAWATFG